jgi:hypothetical protein
MALDVYVMPLVRFKKGDFRTATERLGDNIGAKTTLMDAQGRVVRKSTADQRLADAQIGNSIRQIKQDVLRDNPGVALEWDDSGDIVYSEQGEFQALRTYACWLDCQELFPHFEEPPKGNFYEHPVWQCENTTETFPQLVTYSCYSGYFLPVFFEKVVYTEPHQIAYWEFHRTVGSSPALLRELEGLVELTSLNPAKDYNYGILAERVRIELIQLLEITRLSVQHKLPIIFYG